MRARARALASEGYLVCTPDLYAGGRSLPRLIRLVIGAAVLPLRNDVLRELRLLIRCVRARSDVDPSRVGVIGYSMGAAYAIQLACVERSLRVAGTFCGQLPRPLDALRGSCPIVASYAQRDPTCRGMANRLEKTLRAYGIEHDVKTYAGVAHAFYDPFGPMYDAGAAEDAWIRTRAFIRRHMWDH